MDFNNNETKEVSTKKLLPDGNSAKTGDNNLFFDNLKWLTSRETVQYLRLPSQGALRQLVYRRKIPYCKLGRSLRFSRLELDRFLMSCSSLKRRSA